ncbi:hypothetical protein DBT_0673 [Dissulfuribacter thermophilus]|uniref:HEPN domain-containing protein n=2 Tax=Dissulfuribacter thermophilus TaxID=1156395 RepID=A0A1B9F709_9BACT|nr:hypothetical protein DBT_0673 [Dissulfuribacter thermophilus]
MFLKYARMNLQEAETAIEEKDFSKGKLKCKDCAISLVKAVREAFPRKDLNLEPVDLNKLQSLIFDLTDSKDIATKASELLKQILDEADPKSSSKIEADKLLSLTRSLFQIIHDIFTPTPPI